MGLLSPTPATAEPEVVVLYRLSRLSPDGYPENWPEVERYRAFVTNGRIYRNVTNVYIPEISYVPANQTWEKHNRYHSYLDCSPCYLADLPEALATSSAWEYLAT